MMAAITASQVNTTGSSGTFWIPVPQWLVLDGPTGITPKSFRPLSRHNTKKTHGAVVDRSSCRLLQKQTLLFPLNY